MNKIKQQPTRRQEDEENERGIVHVIKKQCLSSLSLLYILYLCKKRMAERHSKRLKHEEPDVVTSVYECFVCHLKSETCERSVQLPCCRQYVHRRFQMRWERHHNTCREPLSGCNNTLPAPSQTNWSSDDNDPAAAAEAARTEIINH